jgi:serine-type D-Ala-D-Ala carboxypeptidase/endopeptidase (penicillin-binding protein 4)
MRPPEGRRASRVHAVGAAAAVTSMRRPGSRRSQRLVAVLVGAALLLAGCAPAAEPDPSADDERALDPAPAEQALPRIEDEAASPPVPPGPSASQEDEDPPDVEPAAEVDRTQLQSRLAELLDRARAELSGAELGVLVTDAAGRPLLAHDADRPLLPASTLKLVTAAAILVTLGPDARLSTSVETTAPLKDGAVDGDLHLAGTGDPLLATREYGRWVYPARPRTPMEQLADDLVALGVRHVTGDVLGAAEGYAGPLEAEGWRESYYQDFNARRISGLTVDAGLEATYTWPDDEEPEPDDDVEPERVRLELAEDPAEQAAAELVRLLEARGVRVDGEGRAGRPDAPILGTLAQVHGAPMHEVLRFMVQRSDNHAADTLLHVAGRVRTGEGSWERGERALLQVLDHLDVPVDGARFADGSGLSRDDRLTPTTLVELDRAMVAHRHGEVWESLMAVAGEPGTLRGRLRATPAQGRLLAKTGHLRDVASLSGFVRGDTGERLHFALIANDATGADRAVIRALADELALLLSSELLDCQVSLVDGDDGPLGRPPMAVAC